MPRYLLLGLAILSAACASSPENERASEAFAKADHDGDGFVTEGDILVAQTERFRRADTDEDGLVSIAEMAELRDSRPTRRRPVRFADIDANGDGKLDLLEFADPALRRFDRMDRNKDGRLTETEMAASLDRVRERRDLGRGERVNIPRR